MGVSSLAAIAHHHITKDLTSQTPTDIAITMPAKRGAVYGGIYHWDGHQLTTQLQDTILPAEDWTQKLSQWPQPLVSKQIEAGIGLAETTPSLLKLGYDQWKTGNCPDWRTVVPFYGQKPVAS